MKIILFTLLRCFGAFLFLGTCYLIMFPTSGSVQWSELHPERLIAKLGAVIFNLYVGLMFLRATIENTATSLKKPFRNINMAHWSNNNE